MIAVGLVLSAVFVPCAFISGITGQFFRQFALTIAVSTVISTFNSLTLSPALAALLLRAARQGDARGPAPAGVPGPRGAGPGFTCLGPLARALVERSSSRPAASPLATVVDLARSVGVEPEIGGALAGGVVGAIARLARRAGRSTGCCGVVLRPVQPRLPGARRTSTPGSSAGCCGSSCSCCWSTAALLVPDLLGLHEHAARLHPVAGHGLPAGQRPAARLGRRSSGPRTVIGPDRGDRARDARASTHTVGDRRPVVPAERLRLELRLDVRHPRRVRRSATTPETRTYEAIAEQAARARSPARRSPTPIVAVFGPPPVRGVGRAGGFKFMIEDRGDLGPQAARRSRPRTDRRAQANADERRSRRPVGQHLGLPGQRPAALRRRRPRPRACSRASTFRTSFDDAAGLPRLALRQRLQPLRPHLAGDRPGRRQVPRPDRRHQPAAGAQHAAGRWCRSARWPTSARSTARSS